MGNKNLNAAKKAKNDEFWTLMPDIEKEVSQYKDQFEDKVIYCNCDDYRWSNFYKHFKDHFKEYKLKRLIASCLTGECVSYDGNVETTGKLQNGDFRKEESIELLKQADIVITNPPFSLFREYVAQLVKYNKKFLIIGNQNAITCKEIFPLIKDEKIWWGHNSPTDFKRPDGSIKKTVTRWYTNIFIKKQNEELVLTKTYNPKDYPKYDNYLAFEVDKVANIPKDYNGAMAVPITILKYMNKNNIITCEVDGETKFYKILGATSFSKECAGELLIKPEMGTRIDLNGEKKYSKILIQLD